MYPKAFVIFDKIKDNKVGIANKRKSKVAMRVGKYSELQALWEKINEKVILQYYGIDKKLYQKIAYKN